MVARQRRRGAAPDDGARAGTQPVMGGGKPWVMPAAVGPRGLGLICCLFAIFLNLNTLHHDWTLDDRVAVVKNPDVIGENPLGHMLRNDFVKFPAFGHPWDTPEAVCISHRPTTVLMDPTHTLVYACRWDQPHPPTVLMDPTHTLVYSCRWDQPHPLLSSTAVGNAHHRPFVTQVVPATHRPLVPAQHHDNRRGM